MKSSQYLLDLRDSRSWTWLHKYFKDSANSLPVLLSSLSSICMGSSLGISIFGFEFSLFNSQINNPDCSILLEPPSNLILNDMSPPIDRLFAELFREHLVSSVWLEFDFPYEDQPLVYFTVANDMKNKDSPLLSKLVANIFSKANPFFMNLPSQGMPKVDDILNWLSTCPEGQIQQLGFSLRDNNVQPRVLMNLDTKIKSFHLMNTDIRNTLGLPDMAHQCLFAFAYPYTLDQMFACEVVADRCAQSNLRNLRQPPRIKGSRLLSILKKLSEDKHIISTDINQLTTDLCELEHRCSVPSSVLVGGQCIDLSGWNHLKLTFNRLRLANLKIYGGTVRNCFD